MKVSDLKTVFSGSCVITQTVHLPSNPYSGRRNIRFDEVYTGQLRKLENPDILNLKIIHIANIPGGTSRDGIPFLNISVK